MLLDVTVTAGNRDGAGRSHCMEGYTEQHLVSYLQIHTLLAYRNKLGVLVLGFFITKVPGALGSRRV